ncbi:hypothetical protein C9I57_27680 [Trinickia symbiotica]|uniref:Uncharacterized protein n=1 Tax=Trinickia symbiotica TaxID=863227 RepID=A0A2T3XLR2_9BURK|nr:hypothetical protein C9I57_27680 [Trinickia symbiotica]
MTRAPLDERHGVPQAEPIGSARYSTVKAAPTSLRTRDAMMSWFDCELVNASYGAVTPRYSAKSLADWPHSRRNIRSARCNRLTDQGYRKQSRSNGMKIVTRAALPLPWLGVSSLIC